MSIDFFKVSPQFAREAILRGENQEKFVWINPKLSKSFLGKVFFDPLRAALLFAEFAIKMILIDIPLLILGREGMKERVFVDIESMGRNFVKLIPIFGEWLGKIYTIAMNKLFGEKLDSVIFGEKEWKRYFGDVGIVPPLPIGINLDDPCPFWPGQKIGETHALVLVPERVNGEDFNDMNALYSLIQRPQEGTKMKFIPRDPLCFRRPSEGAYWVLMTKDVIPASLGKTYEEQESLLATYPIKILALHKFYLDSLE